MTYAYTTAGWDNFFFAEVGASAALTGLLFVAVSINLPKVIAGPSLPGRAIEALVLLVGVLFDGTCALVPGQPSWLLGAELATIALLQWMWMRALQHRARNTGVPRMYVVMRVVCAQLSTLPVLAGGVSLIAEHGGGLYWCVPGILMSFVTALIAAWVLLVEIQR